VIVTYDEFGGQWDHVPPPGLGTPAAPGQSDSFGPGTRVPALLIARSFTSSTVDHTVYDTTSIPRTIEAQFGLAPLTSRDAAANGEQPTVLDEKLLAVSRRPSASATGRTARPRPAPGCSLRRRLRAAGTGFRPSTRSSCRRRARTCAFRPRRRAPPSSRVAR